MTDTLPSFITLINNEFKIAPTYDEYNGTVYPITGIKIWDQVINSTQVMTFNVTIYNQKPYFNKNPIDQYSYIGVFLAIYSPQ